jgi:hypothetical protein
MVLSASSAQQAASSADISARVETGLLPSVMVEGRPRPTMKLVDRMQYYHVPGVSIAFFDHGHIAWTRTYGMADAETRRPVTPETLFQAGSISKPIAALGALSLVEKGKLKLDSERSKAGKLAGCSGHSSAWLGLQLLGRRLCPPPRKSLQGVLVDFSRLHNHNQVRGRVVDDLNVGNWIALYQE